MYDITHHARHQSGVLFRLIRGSIFEAELQGAEGVAIVVPCGLTALRNDVPNYMIPFGLPKDKIGPFTVFADSTGARKVTILCAENRENALYPARGIPLMLDTILSTFEKMGIQSIAMNGIRVYWPDGVKDRGHLAEHYLVATAQYWCETHQHHFQRIDFVDLRGGFGRISLEDPDEPSVRDMKAMPIMSKGGFYSRQNLPINSAWTREILHHEDRR